MCIYVCITAVGIRLTVVNHSLFGQNHKKTVHFKDPHTRCNNHRHLSSPVKVTVDVVLVKYCGEHSTRVLD